MRRFIAWSLAFTFVSVTAAPCGAQSSPAQSSPAQSAKTSDPETLKTLNDHFPFIVPESAEAWNVRAEALRRRVLVATGLWPMPAKPPIAPVIYGKIERDGFTVEKVYFESLPGHYVTGMLFRPSTENQNGVIDRKRPGVLSPHGHGGRTMRLDDKTLAQQIETGGEVFERSGRYPKLARCAHLARMGCVSFIFDMLGYADSQQIEYKTAHRHADARPEESDRERPCFFGIDADLNLQSIMGLQTWNAIRALDFLSELPDVDAERLGVTGGSGGGTQTILLGAIDPRIKVGFPNGMVSTSMQGGCYCENCNYLRIGTGNVELAALFAPKPQGMTAAKDWTRDMLTDGYPELKQLYKLLGQNQNVMCGDLLKFPHNYNYITRSMMYPWMAEHLGLPNGTPLVEKDFEPFTDEEMKVWGEEHPAPTETGIPHERNVLAWWKEQNDQKLNAMIPDPSADDGKLSERLAEYRQVVGGAWKVFFDRELPSKDDLEISDSGKDPSQPFGTVYLVRHPDWGTEVRVFVQKPYSGSTKRTIMVATPDQTTSDPQTGLFAGLLSLNFDDDRQSTVVIPQFQTASQTQRLIDDKRNYSAFTFGYNRPLIVKRFEQVLCVLAAFAPEADQDLVLWGHGDVEGTAAAAAAIVAGETVDQFNLKNRSLSIQQPDQLQRQCFPAWSGKIFRPTGLAVASRPASDDPGGGNQRFGRTCQANLRRRRCKREA